MESAIAASVGGGISSGARDDDIDSGHGETSDLMTASTGESPNPPVDEVIQNVISICEFDSDKGDQSSPTEKSQVDVSPVQLQAISSTSVSQECPQGDEELAYREQLTVAFEEISSEKKLTEGVPSGKNPEVAQFVDHFTLSMPTSTIRYRDSRAAARVVETNDSQFVLEETYDAVSGNRMVEIRQTPVTTGGELSLRIMYVVVTAFWTGFLFVFCLHILLFLMLDLAVSLGVTSKEEAHIGRAIGSILGFPPLVYGLASSLVLAGSFIMDTWRGHNLIRNFALRSFGGVAVEWIFFSFFLGIPIFIMCCCLLSGTQNWWEYTILVWFSCVGFFYVLFTCNVIGYEIHACALVTRNLGEDSFFSILRRSILLRQIHTYSGTRKVSYLSLGTLADMEYTDRASTRVNQLAETVTHHVSYLTKLTGWDKLSTNGGIGFYENLAENEERLFSLDDARDVRPFLTSDNWGLEKVFCRPTNSRYIAIVNGPGALTLSQLRSSMICSAVGVFLLFFVVLSTLLYFGLGASGTSFGVAMGFIMSFSSIRSTYNLYTTTGRLVFARRKSDTDVIERDSKKSEGVYLVEEVYRVTKPTERFCWFMLFLEFALFFVYPVYSIFANKNRPLGVMFLIFVGITLFRYYCNASLVLEEVGNLDMLQGSTDSSRWRKKSRFNEIVGNITRGRGIAGWMGILGFLGFGFMLLMLGAIGTGSETLTNLAPRAYTNDFQYIQADSLRYPTCQLSGDLNNSPLKRMADYAFLAGLAYFDPQRTQPELDKWFGNGTATDHEDVVQEFRRIRETSSAVSFKLVTFPGAAAFNQSFALVLIRGTINSWDMLTDAQLWSAAGLMQGIRALLPLGIIWTSAIDYLLLVINKIESESVEKVSFYKDTGAFVQFLLSQTGDGDTDLYSGVAVTGHSLGGGLAIITGAQNGIPAVSLSGPNAKLSRKSFDPPILRESLDKKTFNIIPERDIVPMFDDPAQNYQEIRCMAEYQDIIGCHNSVRSLCEILYTCGSQDRPVPCACVTQFGYPEPTPKEGVNVTFQETCRILDDQITSSLTDVAPNS